ncbi:MAG: hypothetical protein EOO38_15115, partial [Cytophagaceae bacterium]
MSNVLIGIIGVILFIGLALAGALFLGERFSNSRTQSEAARYMSEGSQISKAYEMFRLNEGVYPDGEPSSTDAAYAGADADRRRLIQLKKTGYLKSIPLGLSTGTNSADGAWYVNDERGAAFSYIGSETQHQKICAEARKQAGFTDTVHACSDTTISN